MNPGQEKFLNFILERVQEDKVGEAKVLLQDNFEKQAAGTFSAADIAAFAPKILSLLKADKIEEVKAIMTQFASNFTK